MNLSDLIRIPFGYLLDWLYQFAGNYGVALILFSLIVKAVLLPFNAKSKKSSLKMARVAPMAKALEVKYGDDKAKYQQEVSKLYKEEGVSVGGGCLWSLLPLLILLPLYHVIREPLTYVMHIPAEISAQIVEVIKDHVNLTGNEFYHQLFAAKYLGEYSKEILAAIPELNGVLPNPIDFTFLGIDLATVPSWKVWLATSWSAVGGAVLALLSGGSNLLSMWIAQKINNSVTTNEKGEQDKDAAATANQSMGSMMLMMPIMSIVFGFTMPAAITVYWIAQAVFTILTDTPMTLHYRKVYAAEDEVRRQKAAAEAALEAEKERLRAERRAANPDGIVENTSKKKLERKEREEREAAAKRYAVEHGLIESEETEIDSEKCPSGIADRPYCKGRNYDPNRYKK